MVAKQRKRLSLPPSSQMAPSGVVEMLTDYQGGEAGRDGPPSKTCMPLLESFLCPVTHDLMIDPVIMADGHTYECEEIK